MAEALTPGTDLFGYTIEKVLGRGGMGTVYLARQRSLGRQVALKVLHPSRVKTAKAAEEFFREAAAAGRLNHPGLVGVHDLQADPERGIYAFSMEYVAGRTAHKLVSDDGPLSRTAALNIIAQVASALAYAHKHGFVHRDIKPENILVSNEGQARLLDLGLAYNRLGAVGGPQPERHQSSGRRLILVGTPDYSAPEQSRNPDKALPASDVWSLGGVLYFLLTGATPFDGDTVIDLIVAAATEPLEFPAEVTEDCRRLLELMMAKPVAERLADGTAVLAALQQVAQGQRATLPGQAATAVPAPVRRIAPSRRMR